MPHGALHCMHLLSSYVLIVRLVAPHLADIEGMMTLLRCINIMHQHCASAR